MVIERSAEIESLLTGDEVPCVIGDATEEETLLAAGLNRARALVAALPHDADNVYVTLTAHTLCPELQIIARAELPSTESKLKRAGASRVICPQIVGARKISNILHRPNVVDFVEVAADGVDLEMDEYVIGLSRRWPVSRYRIRSFANRPGRSSSPSSALKVKRCTIRNRK